VNGGSSPWRWPLRARSFSASRFFERAPLLLALAFVLGLGLGMAQPMVMSLLYSAAPAGRVGEAVGMRTSLVNLSQTAMPLVFGALGSAL
jgi:MFS family permease